MTTKWHAGCSRNDEINQRRKSKIAFQYLSKIDLICGDVYTSVMRLKLIRNKSEIVKQ